LFGGQASPLPNGEREGVRGSKVLEGNSQIYWVRILLGKNLTFMAESLVIPVKTGIQYHQGKGLNSCRYDSKPSFRRNDKKDESQKFQIFLDRDLMTH